MTEEQIERNLREKFEADLPLALEKASENYEEHLREQFEDSLPDLIEDALADISIADERGAQARVNRDKLHAV
jgi:hypothetical protein